MNFLSHYYFCRTEDPYYNTGLVLPDLVKNFCATHLKPKGQFNRPAFRSLQLGSLKHLETDKIFHNSEYFHQTCAYISEILNNEGSWPRKWFFNHLLCEILTDRILMDRQTELCSEFYNQLKNTDPAEISLFLKLCGIDNYQNFSVGFERFVSIGFIFDYVHNEKIILALGRVYARAGIRYEWTDKDRNTLLRHMPELLRYMDTQLQHLENELK